MKRASFFLALICLALFSFGHVYGQGGSMYLYNVTGLSVGTLDSIECGQPVEFQIGLSNPGGDFTINGSANGFRVYSPDGANWTPSFYIDTTYIQFPSPDTKYDTTWYGKWLNTGLTPPLVWKGADPQIYDGGLFVVTYDNCLIFQ